MLRKLLVGLLVVVPVLRWSVGCSSSHPDTISQYPGEASHGLKPETQLPPTQSAKLCIQTAKQLEAAGYLADAAQQYERARRFNPLDNSIAHRLAILYDRLGDTRQAAVEYENAIQAQPNNSDLLNDFGYFHYARGNWDRAEKAFRKALSINSTHTRAITNLAMTLAQQNRYDESIKYFEKVVAPASAYSNLAAIQAQQGHIELARKTVDKALMFNPDLVQARAIQGFINEQEKHTALAKPTSPAAEQSAFAPAPKPAAKSASAKPAKFVPVVADPVIAPKPQTQTLASAAITQNVHVEAVPEATSPAAMPTPVAVAPAPAVATPAIQPDVAITPAPAQVGTLVEAAAVPAPAASPAPHIDALPVNQSAVPAPAELPPIIAQTQQRKIIAPVGIRAAREEELAVANVATPDPADIAPMVAPASIRNAELAVAAPLDSPRTDALRASSHAAIDAAPMVAPVEIAVPSQPVAQMPALRADETPASHGQGLRAQPVSADVMIDAASPSAVASLSDAAPVSSDATRSAAKSDPLDATVMIAPAQVSANHTANESRPPAVVTRQLAEAPAVAPVSPMIESITPVAPETRVPALRADRAVANSSPRESPGSLAAVVMIDSVAPVAAPEIQQAPAPAHVEPAAPLIAASVTVAPVPADTHEIVLSRKDIATPISVASARSVPLEVAVAPAAAPSPAPEQAEAAVPVAHAQSVPVWVEPPPQVRFTKGRGPSLHRNLQ